MKREWIWASAGGAAIGAIAVALWRLGNPPNMGFCTACFERDAAGALGLLSADKFQYFRPEILGVVLGAFLLSLLRGEFKPRAGSAPVSMFVMGAFMMTGALAFLGCPVRMWERLGAGDLNAAVGLPGLAVGVCAGSFLLKHRYDPPPAREQKGLEGWLFPALGVAAAVLLFLQVAGGLPVLFRASSEGPASLRPGGPSSPVAPLAGIALSLGAGLLIGGIGQLTRFCTLGGILALAAVYGAGSLVFGSFKAGFAGQPLAHTQHLWNFLGLALVGLSGTLMSGCPLRQLVRAGSGDSDAVAATLGLVVGAALCHNLGVAATPAGVPAAGRVAVLAGLAVAAAIGAWPGKGKAT
jgi:YedE family putative selenium metabolism protein